MKWLAPLFLCLISISCGKLKDPEFRRLDDFKLDKLGLQESTISFAAVYYNPNNVGVTVKEADFDVYINSTYLGKFSQPQPVSVNQQAEFSIPLKGTISLAKAIEMKIPQLVGKEVLIKADGKVKVGKGGIFISKDIHYSGKQVLDESLLKNPAGAGF